MNGLISLENFAVQSVSKDILALNEISSQHGLVLTEEEARELAVNECGTLFKADEVFDIEVERAM